MIRAGMPHVHFRLESNCREIRIALKIPKPKQTNGARL